MALQPGTSIADLQISEILGQGSSGITYLVTDPVIGTRFALKEFLPTDLVRRHDDGRVEALNADTARQFADGLKVFLNEARLAGGFDHPNVVRVLRYFQENGTAYILMPFYQGQSLQQLLESDGPLNPDVARALLLASMEGLEYIHAQGVIHQDIKPANIYMTSNGQPVLLDFGAAAASDNDVEGGKRFGSEGYAAPEQSDATGKIGPWTDIYALAACVYRAVTGVIPVPGCSRAQAVETGQKDPLTPFSEMLPAGQYGGIRDAVELGLNIHPQDRPRDVAHWKKSFKSLDWLRSVSSGAAELDQSEEGREWLPKILLAAFIVLMLVIEFFSTRIRRKLARG